MGGLLTVFLQAALVALLLNVTGLETSALRRVVAFASGAFVIHHFLPLRLRLPFFAVLSLAAMGLILGGVHGKNLPDLAVALPRVGIILAVGAGLIALCHLPIGFWKRAALLLAAGIGMAWLRAGGVDSGSLALVWPMLAAFFMFRIIVYLYDVSTAPPPRSLSGALTYFFLLPNFCTLLFPVVDFRTFRQRYYDEPALAIYQRGVKWMTRGTIHLLLYHFISLTLALQATDVANGTDLIQYVITNSFLYLKVSGAFHLFIGVLLLFGFNLPETNRRYFLAASFTDYWRRVNIYWRDFMMKVVYYPTFFRLKKIGQTRALIVATVWTFFVTWALHLYQTWWVTGSAALTWPDSLFWLMLAVLVLGGALWELKRGRKRRLTAPRFSVRDSLGVALRTAATFAVISFLWSLWSAPSVGLWLHIWSLADWHTLAWGGAMLASIMVATIVFEVLPTLRRPPAAAPAAVEYARTAQFRWDALRGVGSLAAVGLGVFALLRLPPDARVSETVADARSVLHSLRQHNPPGEARGYYEKLTAEDPGNQQFWETVRRRALPFHYRGEVVTRTIPDFPFSELLPNVHVQAYDTDFRTNRWGMRNRDCEMQPPPGTLRMALLGSSHVMGWGVPADAVFAPMVESRLNQENGGDGQFELLNFSAPGLGPLGQIQVVKNQVRPFHPHVVIFVAHLIDYDWVNRDAQSCLLARVPYPDPSLDQVLRSARVTTRTNRLMVTERLRPFEPAMLLSAYTEIVRACHAIEALPVCVLLPLPWPEPQEQALRKSVLTTATNAGFVVLDLSRIYEGISPQDLEVHEPGHHSNARAHAIVAAELHRQLIADPRIDLVNRARRLAADPAVTATTPTP